MNTEADILVIVLGALLALLIFAILMVKFIACVYLPFAEDRDFINLEILRSHGNERIHWQHEMKRLYLGMIPIIGKYLVRLSRKRGKKQWEKM
ncbi:MAG: hypothetical protein IKV89_03785 [Clostridia bacterium]|nr:hypothetical protein [Clostridia bacterium]